MYNYELVLVEEKGNIYYNYSNKKSELSQKNIIENGAYLNIKDNGGETILMRAHEYGNDEIVEILKEAGAKE